MQTNFTPLSLALVSLPDCYAHPMRIVVAPSQRVMIGRTDGVQEADIKITDPRVGSRQAEVWYEGGSWFVRDAESPAGTFVNEAAIGYGGTARVAVGDSVRFGGAPFCVEAAAAGEPPTAR